MVLTTGYNPNMLFSKRLLGAKESFVRKIIGILETHPEVISFAGGLPATEAMDLQAISKCQRVPIDETDKLRLEAELQIKYPTTLGDALQYSSSEGKPFFIEQGMRLIEEITGVCYNPEQLLVTTGGQQALDLIARVFLEPHDVIYTYEATYLGFLPVIEMAGVVRVGIPVDERGIIPEELERKLSGSLPQPESRRLVYGIPDGVPLSLLEDLVEREKSILDTARRGKGIYLNTIFDNPGQTVLPYERARRIVELAHEYNLFIVQDEPYGEIGMLQENPVYMNRIAQELGYETNPVIFVLTLSKFIAPGYRLAFVAGDTGFIDKLRVAKAAADLCSSGKAQTEVATYLMNWDIRAHLNELGKLYKAKAELLVEQLKKAPHLSKLIRGIRVGPLFCSLTFTTEFNRKPVSTTKMFSDENILNYGVVAVPLSQCGASDDTGVRVSHGFSSEANIVEGINRWDRLVQEMYFV